ncbi:MAG TPA: glutaminase A [Trebonia sp.]|nr:glutaminase A [Trebonia sp.]
MTVAGDGYVSTGHLPVREDVRAAVDEAYETYRGVRAGHVSEVYPALSRVTPHSFGICLAGVDGSVHAAGDASQPFTIMSVAKPFVFALVCAALGPEQVRKKIGVNATGLPFNSLAAVERGRDGVTNPMVNPGALAATSLLPGDTADAKWEHLTRGLSAFAGRELKLDEEVYASAAATNHRNRAMVSLLESYGRLYCAPDVALDLYTRQSCLTVTATDLAVMGATLADGGLNPLTGEPVTSAVACRCALAVMASAGMYETSGDWLYEVGVSGKSGIAGGIVTVAPGKGGLGTFAPPLDRAGNSVRGQLAARFLSRRLGLSLFASRPAV